MRAAAIGVALAGLGIAGYLTAVHYSGGTPVCAVAHGCATVQNSDYSKLRGVPVAVLGLLGYVAILAALARDGEAADGGRLPVARGTGLLGLADLRRGGRAGRDLHLVRGLGDLHGAAVRADDREAAEGARGGPNVAVVTRPSA